jgi:hemoglobin-like flavoprotein
MSHTWPEYYQHVDEMVGMLLDAVEERCAEDNQNVSAWAKAFQAIKNGEDQ